MATISEKKSFRQHCICRAMRGLPDSRHDAALPTCLAESASCIELAEQPTCARTERCTCLREAQDLHIDFCQSASSLDGCLPLDGATGSKADQVHHVLHTAFYGFDYGWRMANLQHIPRGSKLCARVSKDFIRGHTIFIS